MSQLSGTRNARGPVYNPKFHAFCPNCHRVIYNINNYGPMTPEQHNRTFCVCNGRQTGEIALKVTVYDLEDILTPSEAKTERERQEKEAKKLKNASK